LKDGHEFFNLHQGKKLKSLMQYVQLFNALLHLILMKEEYSHKVTFIGACNLGLASLSFKEMEF
jgi:hypothetical protein